MSLPQNAILSLFSGYLGRLRFPALFGLMGALFLLDLIVPDMIPFLDEVMLGLATLLFGSWRRDRASKGKADTTGPVIDVEPEKPGS